MNESRRVHSISRRIGNSWTLRAFGMLLTLDVLLILLSGLCAVYYHEKSVLGDAWQPELTRSFVWETPDQPSTLMEAEYRFQEPDGAWHAVVLGPMLSVAAPFAVALGIFEGIMLLSEAHHAHRKARKLLKPLNKITRDMQAVSQLQTDSARYEDRLRDLESAIEHLSPTRPGAKLQTGVQELNGLENAINGLLVRMHESYRQQAQFVSDASHELRTPIAVIQGYAHMLARWGKDDPQVLDESIAAIQSESDYMKKLVEELLFLARGEIGRNPFDPKPLSLTGLLREVCEESSMIDAEHEWALRDGPEVSVVADAEMLKQCARVLCENARKYTPAGGRILLRAESEGEWARFSVEDEGIGISAEDVDHIFDRFYRSDPARDRNSGGSGLGLAIAKWIVDRHAGHFDVLSSEGIGTRFTVSLPLHHPESSK